MNIQWNAKDYASGFDFVPKYGEDALSLLTVPAGSRVIDAGCGNGRLTARLVERGYDVLGVDASADMLELAHTTHPELRLLRSDLCTLELDAPADAIFSNAVFHWIDDQDTLLDSLYRNLKPCGELVFEFGGKGCAETVHAELERRFTARGLVYPRVFYFPDIAEYAGRLKAHGFDVRFATLFDRPTPQKGEHGLSEWIRMFVKAPFSGMESAVADTIIRETEEALRDRLLINGTWIVDYVRIRMRCVRTEK